MFAVCSLPYFSPYPSPNHHEVHGGRGCLSPGSPSPACCLAHTRAQRVSEWDCSVVPDSLQPHGQPAGLLCPWNSSGKIPGVGCHFSECLCKISLVEWPLNRRGLWATPWLPKGTQGSAGVPAQLISGEEVSRIRRAGRVRRPLSRTGGKHGPRPRVPQSFHSFWVPLSSVVCSLTPQPQLKEEAPRLGFERFSEKDCL